jgi:outer membrane receptor protein involved in Fe transport
MGRTPLLFLLVAGAANATELPADRPKAKAEVSATVTITAEATPVEQVKSATSVKVITTEQIERSGARDLGQLLNQFFPGQLLSNGGPGSASTLRLGGSRGEDVLVLVDGVRVTDASGLGAVNANNLSLAGIERVEVLSGPCSSLYGANAAGGVVALYTAAGVKEGFSLDSMASLGTRSHRQVGAAPGFGWSSGWVRGSVDASEEQAPTDTVHRFRQNSVFIGAGQQVGEGLLTASYRNAYQGIPIPYAGTSFGTAPRSASAYVGDRETTQRNEQLSASYKVNLLPSLSLDASLGQAYQDRVETRTVLNGGLAYHSTRTQEGVGLHWRPEGGFGGSVLLESFDEKGTMPSYPEGRDKGEGHHFGGVVETFWEPTEVLRLVGTFRHQKDTQRFATAFGLGLPERDAEAGTWRLGATFVFPGGHRFYASGGTGFGVPFLSAVLYHANNLLNPTSFSYDPASYKPLENERSRTAQIGYGYNEGPWSFRLEAQQTTYDNLVYFDLSSTFDYANGQNLRIQGVETALAYRVKRWGAELTVRNQEARDLGAPLDQQLTSAAVVRRPFNSVGLSGYLEQGALRVDGHWSWSGARYENYGGFPSKLAANKTHFNDAGFLAAWTFFPGLSLGLRGEHLFQPRITREDWRNRTYDLRNDSEQIYGFPSQAPIWSLELRYRF